jgi:signal transduction histidine kinase
VTSGSLREDPLATLDVLVRALAQRLNNALATMLLDVEYLDDVVAELVDRAGPTGARVDAVLDDVMGAIKRMRDLARDLEALAGDEHGDAAETFGAAVRMIHPAMLHAELVDQIRGPAQTALPRGELARVALHSLDEVKRAFAGCRGTLVASCDVDGDGGAIVVALRATITDGAHLFDGEHATWREVEARLEPHGGRVTFDRGETGFAIELRLPAAQG